MSAAKSFFFLILVLGAAVLTAGELAIPAARPYFDRSREIPQLEQPTELPATLDPHQFQENRPAYVAYTLAGRIREVIHEVPCFCGCDKEHGHNNLLDCFAGRHGVLCHLCQKEVIFCYLQHKKGKSTHEIRDAMVHGKAAKIDLASRTKSLYREIEKR